MCIIVYIYIIYCIYRVRFSSAAIFGSLCFVLRETHVLQQSFSAFVSASNQSCQCAVCKDLTFLDLNLNLSFALQGYQRLWQRPKGCSNSLNRVQAALEYFGIELLCILHVKHFTMTCFFSLQRGADIHLGKTVITLSLWDLLVYSVCNWVWHLTASTCTWACMTMGLLVSRQIFAVPQHSFTSNAVQLQLWHWSRWSLDPVNPVKW